MEYCNYRKKNLFRNLTSLSSKRENDYKKIVVIFDKPQDIYYLTDFWGEALLVISDNLGTKLVVPKLEYSRAEKKSIDCDVESSERGLSMLQNVVQDLTDDMMVYLHSNDHRLITSVLKKLDGKNIIINDEIISGIRKVKDDNEIKRIQKASAIIDKLFEIALNEIKVNKSEEEIQSILVHEAMNLGARFPAYQFTSNPLIVASGVNSSLPHAETSNKRIKNNEMVVLDITLSYDHYVSDATRTFGIGRVSDEMKNVYNIVKNSHEAGCRQIGISNNFADVDFMCREVIQKSGYGDYFIHSTGHGIGLEVHEPPWIRPNMSNFIEENMTVTVEPGVYLENKFGVRIEDSIHIRKKKSGKVSFDYNSLHNFSKDLIIL